MLSNLGLLLKTKRKNSIGGKTQRRHYVGVGHVRVYRLSIPSPHTPCPLTAEPAPPRLSLFSTEIIAPTCL